MKLNGALAGALLSFLADAGRVDAVRVRGTKTSAMDISSVGNLEPMEPRQLQTADFGQLTCNAALADAVCTPLPADFAGVVPCGVCYSMSDFGGARAGETLTMASGLNVIGRLDFPDGSKVTIETPSVFVQGILSMSSTRAVTGEPDVRIRMTGDTDVNFTPEGENAGACSGGACNVGPKAFVVAGGQLDINGMPDSCPTWSHILSVGHAAQPVPADFPSPPDPPTSSSGALCSASVVNEDFEGGLNQWYGNLGAYESIQEGSHDGSRYLSITERTANFQGPLFELSNEIKECILPDTAYFFNAKIRLSGSTPSLCETAGTDCPILKFGHMDSTNQVKWRELLVLKPGTAVTGGEWFEFKGVFNMHAYQLESSDVWSLLTIAGPEPGVDIAVDDISISLPSAGGYPDPNNVCGNLIVNGDGSGSGGFVFPHQSLLPSNALDLKSDGTNDYFHLNTRNKFHDTMKTDLITGCVAAGNTYTFSGKFRVHTTSSVVVKPYIRTLQPAQDKFEFQPITLCAPQTSADDFVTCGPVDFTFTDVHTTASSVSLVYIIDDATTDVDMDDLSFVFKSGAPSGYVLDSAVTPSCWGAGAEVVLPSENLHHYDAETTTIASVEAGGQIILANPIQRTSQDVNPDYTPELALLSRNIVFETGTTNTNGPSLVVLNTKNVVQKIQGVSLVGFGKQGVLGRNPINFKDNGDLTGSSVKKNSITLSNNRCVNVHGTDGLYIGENVAYDTIGHCYALELGTEINNSFDKNIGILTKKATTQATGETDNTPATFLITHPGNSWTGNVAAGSEFFGFWMDLTIDNALATMNAFSDNTVHSTFHMGIKSWPVGWRPSEPQVLVNTKVYRNRVRGLFIQFSSNVTFDGGLVADTRHAVDIRLSDFITFKNFNILGNTDEYMDIVNTRSGQPSHCGVATTGVRPHINTFTEGSDGTTLENVAFSGYARPECSSTAVAIDMDSHYWKNTFTAPTTFSNVAFDTTASIDAFSLCNIASKGVKDIAILDVDGSFDPAGGTGPGTIVSDDASMTEGKSCVVMTGSCAQYCQGNSALTAEAVAVSAPAPAPDGTAPAPADPSPTPVTAGPMPVPTPTDTFTVATPTNGICIVNGDFEDSNYTDWSRQVTLATSNITSVPGFGGTGLALKVFDRTHLARGGAIQSFETSCLIENEWYEVRADVLAEYADTTDIFNCNPALYYIEDFDGGSCPAIAIFEPNQNIITQILGYTTSTYNSNGWNQIYGVFKATADIINKGTLDIVVARVPTMADLTIDNVVLSPAPSGAAGKTDCTASNLIFNSDAEIGDARSWFIRGHSPLSKIEMAYPGYTGDFCFKHSGQRNRPFMGMLQHLDTDCFTAGSSYMISAWFYYFVTDGEGNETPAMCQKENVFLSDACPTFEIAGQNGAPSLGRLANTAAAPIVGGWNKYEATFTATSDLIGTGKIWVTVHSVGPGANYFLDDVQIVPV